jgi:hypothetical protein
MSSQPTSKREETEMKSGTGSNEGKQEVGSGYLSLVSHNGTLFEPISSLELKFLKVLLGTLSGRKRTKKMTPSEANPARLSLKYGLWTATIRARKAFGGRRCTERILRDVKLPGEGVLLDLCVYRMEYQA